MTTRIDIINYLIKKNNYKTYLEIGVQNGISFRAIELPVENKVGVDPDPFSKATVYMTSDEFFEQNLKKFDIIFIDGLHEADAVLRDIFNSLEILNEGGIIVCHDMNPLTEAAQAVPRVQKLWNGDCWKALVSLRNHYHNLLVNTVDTDHGCAVISVLKEKQSSFNTNPNDWTFENLEKNRKGWLNLISVEEFKQLY